MKAVMISIRHQYFTMVSILLITVLLITGMAGCDAGGDGNLPPSENLEIRTWYDLDAIRDNLNGNHTLMNDLDSTTIGYDKLASPTANEGEGWQPIGTWQVSAFTGSFNGQGHEIRDLFINRPDENFVGLFSYVNGEGRIQDIGVVNVTVTGKRGVGGLVGRNLIGTVSNSYSMGSVNGTNYVGGLVGYIFNGTVSNCYSTGNVAGNSYIGGLVGFLHELYELEAYFPDSATGDIKFEGAVVLSEGGTLIDCYSTGNVTGNSCVGGLVGYLEESLELLSTVSNSFWDIETSGQSISEGGTGKNTTEMQDITTFSDAGWNIIAVAINETNPTYIWNIVNDVTYPFLSWQS